MLHGESEFSFDHLQTSCLGLFFNILLCLHINLTDDLLLNMGYSIKCEHSVSIYNWNYN